MCFVIYILLVDLLLSLSIYTHKSIIYIFLHVPVTRSRALSWRDSLLLDARAAKLSLDIIYLNSYVCTFSLKISFFVFLQNLPTTPTPPTCDESLVTLDDIREMYLEICQMLVSNYKKVSFYI